jgi:hypothetical protein
MGRIEGNVQCSEEAVLCLPQVVFTGSTNRETATGLQESGVSEKASEAGTGISLAAALSQLAFIRLFAVSAAVWHDAQAFDKH